MEVWEKMKPAMALALSFVILQLDMLISYVAGHNFRFRCDGSGVRMVVLGVAIRRLKSSNVGAFTLSSLGSFLSVAVRTKKLKLFPQR